MPDRCFVAADLPPHTMAALSHAAALLADGAPGWRGEKWVAPDLFHVTIAFLGAIDDAATDGTFARLAAVTRDFMPLSLRPSGVRAVPGLHHASMIWALLDEPDGSMGPLRDALLAAAGCEPDPRSFSPHVTFVRARRPRSVHADVIAAADAVLSHSGKQPDGSVSVPALTVYSSTLGPTGPTYRELTRLPLGGGERGRAD